MSNRPPTEKNRWLSSFAISTLASSAPSPRIWRSSLSALLGISIRSSPLTPPTACRRSAKASRCPSVATIDALSGFNSSRTPVQREPVLVLRCCKHCPVHQSGEHGGRQRERGFRQFGQGREIVRCHARQLERGPLAGELYPVVFQTPETDFAVRQRSNDLH